ncbi:hypothetical protein ABFX02_09G031600 [Erythranthe guttata]
MVAISLYKGNLHKVPDVPRSWPCPSPTISPKDFKNLLRRRARALSRLHSSDDDVAAISNPNPAPAPNSIPEPANSAPILPDNAVSDSDGGVIADNPCSEAELLPAGDLKDGEGEKEEEEVREEGKMADEGKDSVRKMMDRTDAMVEVENPVVQKSNEENSSSEVEKRKKEVQEKLETLNDKKHGLVQVLKQILKAEEQLKRQNSTQGISGRPPLPLQVDTTNDSGSMTRINTPRVGSDGNPSGETEGGGEADDVSNHNMHSRNLPRMSSTSPSSDSQQRKPASNMVPHSYRTTLGVVGSPSRFAPAGQGHSVTVSGASFIASSPSPAASGGTSVFRDSRLPSPWN